MPRYPKGYTAQHEEDKWLDEHWDELGLPGYGFFVELGAGDGVTLSNTLALERDRGWHGLLIEPHPAQRRYAMRAKRPRCRIDKRAVGPAGLIQFAVCEDPYLSGELRTLDHPDSRVRAVDVIEVECAPLSTIIDQYRPAGPDLLSLDVEGKELAVWETLDLSRHRPQIAIVELRTWGLPDISDDIVERLYDDGFDLIERTYHNGIFKSRAGQDV